MFILQLNDMRYSNVEILIPVVRAESKEDLSNLLTNEKTVCYKDNQWYKCFKKDGILEWFNAPHDFDACIINVEIADKWAEDAREQYLQKVMSVPTL